MSLSLTSLPPELFSCIVASIELKRTLCNLARCSHQVYLYTVPHLYRHVAIQEFATLESLQNGQLRNLASLLLRRPDLAALVRCFKLQVIPPSGITRLSSSEESEDSEYSSEFEEPEEVKECVSADFFKVDQTLRTAIKALVLSKEEEIKWLSDLTYPHKCHPDLILALLLPALLKVEEVSLNFEIDLNTKYVERMIRRAVRREGPFEIQPPFEALAVFMHSHETDKVENLRSTGFLTSLLKLPAIQVISGGFGNRRNDESGEEKSLIELESSSSPLTRLYLVAHEEGAEWSTTDLGHILRAPKALKTFSYKVCNPVHINFRDIRHVLRPYENCLEYLNFSYDESHEQFHDLGANTEFWGPMTSFISFTALKVFRTAALFLETTDHRTERHSLVNIFPPSLETLHLTRLKADTESVLQVVEHLLAQKSPQQIPSLKNLILEESEWTIGHRAALVDVMSPTWKITQETAVGRLFTVAAAHGVSVDIILNPPD